MRSFREQRQRLWNNSLNKSTDSSLEQIQDAIRVGGIQGAFTSLGTRVASSLGLAAQDAICSLSGSAAQDAIGNASAAESDELEESSESAPICELPDAYELPDIYELPEFTSDELSGSSPNL